MTVSPVRRDWLCGPLPWVLGNALIAAQFLFDVQALDANGLVGGHAAWGRDFANLWTAGRALLAGRAELIYDLAAYHDFQTGLFGSMDVHNYSYPPLALPLALPFALLPYGVALAAWLAITGALFVRAAAPWWRGRTGLPTALLLLTPAALVNIWAGHYGFLIGALLLFGWRAIEENLPLRAGLCFGLIAIKPHLGLLIPLMLAARGQWRAMVAATATVALLGSASLLLFGPAPWQAYFTTTAALQASLIDAQDSFFGRMSTSTATALFALGAGKAVAVAGQLAAATAGIALAWLAARRGTARDAALAGATATFLVLPYGFCYDLTVMALAAAVTMRDPTAPRGSRLAALGGFLAPQLGMLLAAFGLPVMPALLASFALEQARALVSGRRDGPAGAGAAR